MSIDRSGTDAVFRLVLYDASGNVISIPEGPFIVWDGCVAAETKNIVDMSGRSLPAH